MSSDRSILNTGRRGMRRGFTLLEAVLAMVIGSLVVLAAFSLFRVVERSDKRSEVHMSEELQLATAHETIRRAFTMLLMSDQQPPNEKEIDDFLKKDDERNSGDRAEEPDEEATATRFEIQPDTTNAFRMTIGTEDQPRQARSQIVRLTLRDSPIVGAGEKTEEQKLQEELVKQRYLSKASSRLAERSGKSGSSDRSGSGARTGSLSSALDLAKRAAGGGGGKSGSGEGSNMDSGRSESRRNISLRPKPGSGGRAGASASGSGLHDLFGDDASSGADRSASDRLEDEDEDRPRAPGVRGVFEILPDGADPTDTGPAQVSADGGPSYSLWWRELPPIQIDSSGIDGAGADAPGSLFDKSDRKNASDRAKDRTGAGGPSGDAIDRRIQQLADASDSSGRRIKLLSGLKACHWTAFRSRKERDKITAKFVGHLPAYVELEIITARGRRENWMFDLAWQQGPEPGSVLPDRPDALNGINPQSGGDPTGGDPNNPNNKPGDPNNPGGPTTNPGGGTKPGTNNPGGTKPGGGKPGIGTPATNIPGGKK